MLSDAGSYAFGLGELCFPTRGVMLSDSGSYAFQLGELCFPTPKAMLSDIKSYALAADGQGFESRKARKWLTNSNLGAFLVLAIFPPRGPSFRRTGENEGEKRHFFNFSDNKTLCNSCTNARFKTRWQATPTAGQRPLNSANARL